MMALITEKEMMQFSLRAQQLTRGADQAKIRIGVVGLLCVCAIFCGLVEYAVSYEIFAYLKQPLPGETSHWSISLFAMTGVLMAVALHLHAHQHPDSVAVRALRLSVGILVPLYGLGAGAALAAILYFDGADAIFSSAQAGADLFATVAESSGSSWVASLAPHASLLFVLGCGGLGVIALYLTHSLLSLIRSNLEYVNERVQIASEARSHLRTIEECDRQFSELTSERNQLVALDAKAEEYSFANKIVAAINKELLFIEQGLIKEQLRPKPAPNRFELMGEAESLDTKELQRRIAALKSITPKSVLDAFHAEPTSRSKS